MSWHRRGNGSEATPSWLIIVFAYTFRGLVYGFKKLFCCLRYSREIRMLQHTIPYLVKPTRANLFRILFNVINYYSRCDNPWSSIILFRHLLIKSIILSMACIVIVSVFINYEKFMKAFLREFPDGISRLQREDASLYETWQGRVFGGKI